MSGFDDRHTNEQDREIINKPPMVKDTLQKEIRLLRKKLRGDFPSEIPRDSEEAALWWMARQKPANDRTERPVQIALQGREATRWYNPYAERLIASLRRFVRLKPQERDFVLAAIEDYVWYNGDSFDFFKSLYEETQRMRSMGAKKYRAESITRLKDMIRRIGREAKPAR